MTRIEVLEALWARGVKDVRVTERERPVTRHRVTIYVTVGDRPAVAWAEGGWESILLSLCVQLDLWAAGTRRGDASRAH